MKNSDRRNFLLKSGAFLSSAAAASMTTPGKVAYAKSTSFHKNFRKAHMLNDDALNISKDFKYTYIISSTDQISKSEVMGENTDFIAYLPGKNKDQGYLWVNNEALHQNILWGKSIKSSEKTKKQIEYEKSQVGGTYVEVVRKDGKWSYVKDSDHNFKITGQTPIKMCGPSEERTIEGTLGNCGGGHTPWGRVLTCEENTQDFYFKENLNHGLGWNKFDSSKDEKDYGWVVEIDPVSKSARKLSALGRFAHEGATVYAKKDEKVVVYMGEDRRGGALFKFISKYSYTGNNDKDKDLLVEGDLYAANLSQGRWEKLSPNHPKLKGNTNFKTKASIVENASVVAKIIGATPLNRAEDIEIDPKTGDIMIALTNNSNAGDFYGQILKVTEAETHSKSMNFTHAPFLVGGPQSGFSCPDNLVYGPDGALYIATDISGSSLGKGSQRHFKKNGLFKVEFDSSGNPVAIPLLFAPFEAEVTGPCFSDDGTTLFVSIQHPGETSFKTKDGYTSHWPQGKGRPKSTVIAIQRA
jgi:uncharacterized protein